MWLKAQDVKMEQRKHLQKHKYTLKRKWSSTQKNNKTKISCKDELALETAPGMVTIKPLLLPQSKFHQNNSQNLKFIQQPKPNYVTLLK